jgi:hypothetical protein
MKGCLLRFLTAVLAVGWSARIFAANPTNAPVVAPFIDYLSPQDEAQTFIMQPGYKMELVVSDPIIKEPVVAVFDGNGRMYVAEMRSYMQNIDGLVQQGRWGLRQAHRFCRQHPSAPHDPAAGGRSPDQRNRFGRHLAL